MASPDFSEYIDLTIYDEQPGDIYDAAITYARTALPEFSPRVGTVEDAVLQAMSYVSGTMTGAMNRLPNGLMEGILNLLGFSRSEATFATGYVNFTAVDDSGVTIPSGTQVAYREVTSTGTINHIFTTDEAVTITAGNTTTSSPVPVTAVIAGQKPPISDGNTMLIVSASNRLLSSTFSGNVNQGAAGESDADYMTRGRAYLATLNQSLATASQISNYILVNYPEIYRATTLNTTKVETGQGVYIYNYSSSLIGASVSFDPTTDIDPTPVAGDVVRVYGASSSQFNGFFEIDSLDSSNIFLTTSGLTAASAAESFTIEFLETLTTSASSYGGYVVTAVAGTSGSPISDAYRSNVESAIGSMIIAGLNFSTVNAIVVPVEATVDIVVAPGYDEIEIRTAVDAAITSYLSPDSWDWSSRIRVNSVISRASQVSGVSYVGSVVLAIDAGEPNASVDGVTGDVVFTRKGTLPEATVSVGTTTE
jgi:hypothetical protein